MIHKRDREVQWLEFELFQPFPKLKHAIFLRHGGYSKGAYNSLNLSYTMGDDPYNVARNHKIALGCLGVDSSVSLQQVHGTHVVLIEDTTSPERQQGDAIMTDLRDVALQITHADCQAAIIYDPVKHVLALVHCGWRGQVGNIYAKTIAMLGRTFGSRPADLHVGIGPSLGPSHAEFINYREEFPSSFWDFQRSPNHFDLWSLANKQLEECGILPNHRQLACMCTYANERDCFSFRRQQRITGAHATFASLL
jgi:YfiH family protein